MNRFALALVASATIGAGCLSRPVTFNDQRCQLTYPADLLTNPATYQSYVVIGTLFSHVDNADVRNAAELAVRQVNALGGLGDGKFIGLVHCDYGTRADDTRTETQAINDSVAYLSNVLHVPAIIGPRGSSRATVAFSVPLASTTTPPLLISPSATSTSLTSLDSVMSDQSPGRFWRTVPLDTLQARSTATDLINRNVPRITMIYDSELYGMSYSAELETRYANATRTVRRIQFTRGMAATTLPTMLSDTMSQEVVFIATNLSDHTAFLDAVNRDTAAQAYFSTRNLFFSAVGRDASVFTPYPAILPRLRGTRPAPPVNAALANAFTAAYVAQYPGNFDLSTSTFVANSYDAAWLVLAGVAWSSKQEPGGAITPVGIGRGLRKLSTATGPTINLQPSEWLTLRAAMYAGTGVNVVGTSGNLDYDPATEETVAPIEIWRVNTSATPAFVADHVDQY